MFTQFAVFISAYFPMFAEWGLLNYAIRISIKCFLSYILHYLRQDDPQQEFHSKQSATKHETFDSNFGITISFQRR